MALQEFINELSSYIGAYNQTGTSTMKNSRDSSEGTTNNISSTPSREFLESIGIDSKKIDTSEPTMKSNIQYDQPIQVNSRTIMSNARLKSLQESTCIYLNPNVVTNQHRLDMISNRYNADRGTWYLESITPPSRVSVDNLSYGFCLAQQIDILVDYKSTSQNRYFYAAYKTHQVRDDELTILLLSMPKNIYLSYSTNDKPSIMIRMMYQTLFSAAIEKHHNHIILPMNDLINDPDSNHYIPNSNHLRLLLEVSKEFPTLNIIICADITSSRNPLKVREIFAQNNNPVNVAFVDKNPIALADELRKNNLKCALYNPSSCNLFRGDVEPVTDISLANSISQQIACLTTANIAARSLNQKLYSDNVHMLQPNHPAQTSTSVAGGGAASVAPGNGNNDVNSSDLNSGHDKALSNPKVGPSEDCNENIKDSKLLVNLPKEHRDLMLNAIEQLAKYAYENTNNYKDKGSESRVAISAARTYYNNLSKCLKSNTSSIQDFQHTLEDAYNEMSKHRRVGIFHSILIAIVDIWNAIKAFCLCEDTVQNEEDAPKVKIGETSHGFFNLTKRQEIIIDIDKTLNNILSTQAS